MNTKKDLSDVLIISDFDGTLLGSDKKIPSRNIEAIERLKKQGGVFVVASGRANFVLEKNAPEIEYIVNGPCVYTNGSYFYDYQTKTRSNEKYLEESICREMFYLIRDISKEAGIRIARGDDYLTPDANEEIKRQIANGYMNNAVIATYETVPVDKINKVTVCAPEAVVLEAKKQIEEKYSEYVDIFQSWETLIDIQPKNVSKSVAVDELREYYMQKGKKMRIFAVGDYENDMGMLERADYSCCPSNSLEKVKDFCKVHLCSNDEGCIADLIEKIENGLV
ncbi:MAG: HAD-IIB family hydrolase [Clostridia bacterium]|nr:HAD-IIB family hydrolase [Clostridia bacterium]